MSGFGSNVEWPEAMLDFRDAGTAASERSSMKSFTIKSLLWTGQCLRPLGNLEGLTENLSIVNWGPRMDCLELVCVRIEEVSLLEDCMVLAGNMAQYYY